MNQSWFSEQARKKIFVCPLLWRIRQNAQHDQLTEEEK